MPHQRSTVARRHALTLNTLESLRRLSFSLAVLLLSGVCIVVKAQSVPMRDVKVNERAVVTTARTTRREVATSRKDATASRENAGASREDASALSGNTSAAKSKRAAEAPLVTVSKAGPSSSLFKPEAPHAMQETKGEARVVELREQLKNAKDAMERERLQRALVDCLLALDQKDEALLLLRAMLKDERVDPAGFYNTGNALARLGETDAAIEAYRKAIAQRHGNYSRALNNLGVMLLRQGRWDEAQDAFESALKQESFRYSEASYNLGRLYAARGEMESAAREWKRTLQLQPDHAAAREALARLEDGNAERAFSLSSETGAGAGSSTMTEGARPMLKNRSASVEAKSGYAETKGNYAKTAGSAILTSDPDAPQLRPFAVDPRTYDLLQRARVARDAGHTDEAVADYRHALSLRGGFFPPASLELSYLLINLNRLDEAIASLRVLTDRGGTSYPMAFYHLGRLYEQQGKLALAGQAFERAAHAAGETWPQFLLDLSRVREKEGNLTDALSAMETYIRNTGRSGNTPEWASMRLNGLRQKLAAQGTRPPTQK